MNNKRVCASHQRERWNAKTEVTVDQVTNRIEIPTAMSRFFATQYIATVALHSCFNRTRHVKGTLQRVVNAPFARVDVLKPEVLYARLFRFTWHNSLMR